MAGTVTISVSIPVELSIEIEAYLDSNKLTRSEFVKESIRSFLNKKKEEQETFETVNKIYEEIIKMKKGQGLKSPDPL